MFYGSVYTDVFNALLSVARQETRKVSGHPQTESREQIQTVGDGSELSNTGLGLTNCIFLVLY